MNTRKSWRIAGTALLSCALGVGLASARLPQQPMDEAAKTRVEESRTKAAEATKKARDDEEKAMDRVAERYRKEKGIKSAATTAPAPTKK